MKAQLTLSTAAALIKLRNFEDLQPIMDWLKAEKQVALEQCAMAPMEHIGDARGRAQFLMYLLDQVDKSPETAGKLAAQAAAHRRP